MEELAYCGVTQFLRVGTTGAIQEDVALGEIILPAAAVRGDGTTKEYVGNRALAGANSEVVAALRKSAEEAKVSYHVGTVRTNDAFYAASDFECNESTPEVGSIEL